MGFEMLLIGALENLSYASAGYFRARKEDDKTKFDSKQYIKTIIVGVIPPAVVLLLGAFGITLPPGFEVVNFLGPVLDKALKAL